jgi:hypothetical protein
MAARNRPNVCLLLAWLALVHTSHSHVDELRALMPEHVVMCHVNGRAAGIAIDEHIDNDTRFARANRSVIDMPTRGFLQALQQIGYVGRLAGRRQESMNEMASDEERVVKGRWRRDDNSCAGRLVIASNSYMVDHAIQST